MKQTRSSNAPSRRAQAGSARWITLVLAVLVAAVGGWFVMAPAPEAPETRFTSIQGETFTTSSLRGKVVLVNFWATSCVTCVKKMPMITDSFHKYGPQGYDVVAVAMQYDPANYVLNFVETRELPFTVTLDSMGEIAKAFGDVRLTPTAFLLDRDGRVVKRYLGDVDQAVFFADIENALRS